MEQIRVQDFGPIVDIEIIIKEINIFTGPVSGGKSTVARLISVFNEPALRINPNYSQFKKLLVDYNIDFEITGTTYIHYEKGEWEIELKEHIILANFLDQTISAVFNPIYVPVERNVLFILPKTIFELTTSNISLPKRILDFAAMFEQARSSLKEIRVDFLNVIYEFDGIDDYIQDINDLRIKLSHASSGLKAVVPLILIIQFNAIEGKKKSSLFVIEEPELNLYPLAQKEVIEFIVSRVNKSKDKVIFTTHSPYLLTSIDNMIRAELVAGLGSQILKQVNDLVPSENWLKFENISCYHFEMGRCQSTLDEETSSIAPSKIDDVSNKLADTFEKLLELKYPVL
jgi:hypothetical protein